MLFRFTKLWVAVGLMLAVWALGLTRQPETRKWVRPVGSPPGPVKILQFYASVGMLTQGDKALLCYGVEKALVDLKDKVPADKLADIEGKVASLRKSLVAMTLRTALPVH